MSLAIDGLISGLNTTSLIDQLMAVEAAPQALLKNRVTTSQALVGAMQGLNANVASLATLATKTALPATRDLFSATSSATSVSVSAASGASVGTLALSVTSVARGQVSVSAAMTVWPDSPATFTIVGADGTKTELTAATSSLDDVAAAVNGSTTGVKAIKVAAGTDAGTGAQQYRLQFSSSTTGASSAFSIYRGTAADVTAGTATNLLAATGAATVTAASDASITLWAGTSAQQAITSSTNSFANILPGVAVTVSQVEASPVSITVARDTAGVGNVASALVDGLSSVFSLVDQSSSVSTSTSATGVVSTRAGVFTGNSTVLDVRQRIISAASDPVNGRSPSEIGLTLTRGGTTQYDSAKFSAALASDPAGTQAMLQAVATRIAAAATAASDKYTGTITTAITGQQSTVASLSSQITDWDARLASQRAGLQATYSKLEVSLSNLKAQSAWLSSQIAGLSSGSTTSSSSTTG
jgi:flagellar hook-associated protein 2